MGKNSNWVLGTCMVYFRYMKLFFGIVFIIVLVIGGFVVFGHLTSQAPSVDTIREALLRATIVVPEIDVSASLTDGEGTFSNGPVSGTVSLAQGPGWVVLNRAGSVIQDVFSIFWVNAGGSGTFAYLGHFSYDSAGNVFLYQEASLLGDRVVIKDLSLHKQSIVQVSFYDHGPGEAMAQEPTLLRVKQFALHDGALVEVELKNDLIVVDTPLVGSEVSSPLEITGKARGYWFFEASFPIVVVDWDGKIIGQGIAQSTSEWMTQEFVPFKATITFDASSTVSNRGALILKKDNPSGLPENDDAFEIPIFFAQ